MKRKTILLMWYVLALTSIIFPFSIYAKSEEPLKYDINSAGVGAEGIALVKVSIYVNKPKNATVELLKKAAVHGIIFRGVNETGVTGFNNLQPLASSPAVAQQYGDFFDSFFQSGGQYLSYANVVESTTETVRTNKKEYRVSTVIKVSRDQLRKVLQQAGIIRKMTDGF